MLLTGDAEAETEERLMKAGANIKTKILKVGHHGSRYASSEKFLRQGGFEVAVISDGAENRYGHPNQDALDRIRQLGMKIHRTDLEGEITIISRGTGYEIKTERTPTGDVWAGRTPPGDDRARESSDARVVQTNEAWRRQQISMSTEKKSAASRQIRAEINRIEDGGMAVLTIGDDKKTQVDIPVSLLPEGASDGDHLRITISVDKESRETAASRVKRLQDKLAQAGGAEDQKDFKL